jgi:hypothetical protein
MSHWLRHQLRTRHRRAAAEADCWTDFVIGLADKYQRRAIRSLVDEA